MVKTAISKVWELESKPGRSSVKKTVSMIDSHRGQISASEGGSVDSVLSRHKKVKQSIGDSMKLAVAFPKSPLLSGIVEGVKSPFSSIYHGFSDAATIHKNLHHAYEAEEGFRNLRNAQLGRAIGGAATVGGVGVGGYALGKHVGGKEKEANGDMLQYFQDNPQKLKEKQERDKRKKKIAMTAMQPPADPQIQQQWRGRPAKMKDTTTVAGAMQDASKMLAPASTTAGPTS